MKMKTILLVGALALSTFNLSAQLALPVPSPKASVMQTFGLTDVKIDYSSPAMKGRTIFGGLVPYGEVWRAGANSATAITFSSNVEIAGTAVKSGEYALFAIPNKDNWTIILNSNEGQKGSTNYKKELDVLRFDVKPSMSSEVNERLNYRITAIDDNTAEVSLYWEKVKVSFTVKGNAKDMAKANIEKFNKEQAGTWYALANGAKYMVENDLNIEDANKMADKSIATMDHFYNKWVKAMIMNKQGNAKEALKFATEAKAFGEKNPSGFYDAYKADIEKAVAEWTVAAAAKKKK